MPLLSGLGELFLEEGFMVFRKIIATKEFTFEKYKSITTINTKLLNHEKNLILFANSNVHVLQKKIKYS